MTLSTRSLRRLVTLGAIGVVLVPIAACSDDEPKQGEAALQLDGKARVERQDGGDETLDGDDTLRVGDEITIQEGNAVLRLPGGTVLELRAATGGADATALVMGPKPVLEAGEVLVIAEDDIELDVAGTDVVVEKGAARIGRGVGTSAGSYTARVHLDSAGQKRDVPPLRQMQVATLGQPPQTASPFTYSSSDPWDRRFLGGAIDLGGRLEALAIGFTQNLRAGQGGTAAFFVSVLPALGGEATFSDQLVDPARDAGETLVGAAIAQLGQRGTFAERWASVFSFRDAGAAWGLVALDQGVEAGPVLAALQGAVEAAPLDTATTRRPPRTTPSTVSPVVPTTVVPGRPASPTTTTTTTPLPTPGEDDNDGLLAPILNPLLEPVTNVLNSLVNGLLGGLLG
jgi:hypothetical protein